MKANEFERRMRDGEIYHSLRIPSGMVAVIRVDGRSFSRFTESRFEKPFDFGFHEHMTATATALVQSMEGTYAYTESDEISLLLPRNWDLFNREIEKTISLSAGAASAAFSISCGEPASFDARIWVGADVESVVDYFRWRQNDAGRCCLNGWCYWTLRNEGHTVGEATEALHRLDVSAKNELLFQRGINFNDLPLWQKRGVGVRYINEAKRGVDLRSGEPTSTVRSALTVDRELPIADAYSDYIRSLLT